MKFRATSLARRCGHAGPRLDILAEDRSFGSLSVASLAARTGRWIEPTLKLQTPEKPKPLAREKGEDDPDAWDSEPPKGRFVLYWGCSESVRAGQPKVMNLETATPAELGKFFESRRAT